MRRTVLLVAASLALATPRLGAQDAPAPAPATTEAAPIGAPATVAAEPAAPVASGLPERAAPPRTLRAHWHVFVAFALTWLLLFGYALSLGRRFTRVEAELQRLGRLPE